MMRDVIYAGVKTNLLSFGGFEEDPVGSSTNFLIEDITVRDSVLEVANSLILIKEYKYTGDSQLIISDSSFTNLEFQNFGNLIELK